MSSQCKRKGKVDKGLIRKGKETTRDKGLTWIGGHDFKKAGGVLGRRAQRLPPWCSETVKQIVSE